MNDPENDEIDRLLLAHFDGPVPEDGFCDSVMQRLPARPPRRTWPLAVGAAIGGALCWLSLVSTPLLGIGWRDWVSGELSAPALLLLATMAGGSLIALAWTAAEASPPAPPQRPRSIPRAS
ncbi:MAG TPA: hypothetical protein VG889_12535 [Rhizomicrobium sp.]|nr:hypothetical protein [Rhizomicrobium sp.]